MKAGHRQFRELLHRLFRELPNEVRAAIEARYQACRIDVSFLRLLLLVAAGKLIVTGAESIAAAYGVSQFVIGATVVAVGTSVPELATAVIAKLKGHDEVGLGTVLGSNIFNGLFIVGLVAVIHPIEISWRTVLVALTFGLIALICSFPPGSGLIDRRRGFLLIALYCFYVATALQG